MLSIRLRQLRKSAGVNQAEIAGLLNISREAYSMYETGRRQPSNEMLRILADYYHVSVDYILGRTDVPELARHLGERERFLLEAFRSVDARAQDTILTLLKYEAYRSNANKDH